MSILRGLLAEIDGPQGAKIKVVKKQNELFRLTTTAPLLADLRLEVRAMRFGKTPTTLPGGALQLILMACAKRLFIPKACEVVHMLSDVFGQFARCREVCSAFYLAMVDCWPLLQEEFVKSMAAFIKTDPQSSLRIPINSVTKVMNALDPSLMKNKRNEMDLPAAADALCWTFHERLKRHLRYHCALYFMMLFSNDIKIREGEIMDTKNIPTLSGFAAYIHTAFGGIIKESIKTGDRNATIVLFYESERAPAWNMLPDEMNTKNLEDYLSSLDRDPGMGKLICAPAGLFEGEWPEVEEVGMCFRNYIFEGRDMVMPPIRQVKKATVNVITLVAEITLPMRLLLRPTVCPEGSVLDWTPYFISNPGENYYTMNVTTDMLTQSSWLAEMPKGFEIIDHQAQSINARFALNTDASMDAGYFAIWADVMLSHSATAAFRGRVNNLPLFRNFFIVEQSIESQLPRHLCRDVHIEDPEYDSSPIQQDWGCTHATEGDLWHLVLDDDFAQQFNNPTTNPARSSWATSTFFDMSLDFLKTDKGIGFQFWQAKNTIWMERLEAEDIAPLMSKMDTSWRRHQFNSAEVVVEAQHRDVSQATGVNRQHTRYHRMITYSTFYTGRSR